VAPERVDALLDALHARGALAAAVVGRLAPREGASLRVRAHAAANAPAGRG
jgi:hypothetical protein